MLTEMRRQVQSVLYAVPVKRKPALRRSDLPDTLFATDLPLVAEKLLLTPSVRKWRGLAGEPECTTAG